MVAEDFISFISRMDESAVIGLIRVTSRKNLLKLRRYAGLRDCTEKNCAEPMPCSHVRDHRCPLPDSAIIELMYRLYPFSRKTRATCCGDPPPDPVASDVDTHEDKVLVMAERVNLGLSPFNDRDRYHRNGPVLKHYGRELIRRRNGTDTPGELKRLD